MASRDDVFERFCARLRHELTPFARTPEYGNLRYQVSVWETAGGCRITNLALVYDVSGGRQTGLAAVHETLDWRTDPINVAFDHGTGLFSLWDETERLTTDVDEVIAWILPRVEAIPKSL